MRNAPLFAYAALVKLSGDFNSCMGHTDYFNEIGNCSSELYMYVHVDHSRTQTSYYSLHPQIALLPRQLAPKLTNVVKLTAKQK